MSAAAQSLEEILARSQLTSLEAVRIARRLGEYLCSIHSAGGAYLRLSPRRVRMDDDGAVFLLAASSSEPGDTAMAPDPTYEAPEQRRGGTGDQRSDLWALGAVLRRMLERRPASMSAGGAGAETSNAASAYRGRTAIQVPLVEDILSHCLAADPEDRYQRAEDLTADLRRLEKQMADPRGGTDRTEDAAGEPPRPEALGSRLRLARFGLERRQPASWWSLALLPSIVLLVLTMGVLYCRHGSG